MMDAREKYGQRNRLPERNRRQSQRNRGGLSEYRFAWVKSHNGRARLESNWGFIPTPLAVETRTVANNREEICKS